MPAANSASALPATSPLTPIGVARDVEPDPGLWIDSTALVLGALVVVAAVLVLAAWPAWRSATTRAERRDGGSALPHRVAHALAATGASPAMTAGVRMALEPGRGRTSVPARSTIVSALLAVAVVTGAIVFAGSLDHLVSTPRLYGWNWDVEVQLDSSSPTYATDTAQVAQLLDSSRAVKGWSRASLSDVTLDGHSMPAVGVEPGKGPVYPSIVSGRSPRRDDEIALGVRTLRTLGVAVGDTVTASLEGGGTTRLRVVGRVVLPGFGTYPGSDKTALGEGAVLTAAELRRAGPDFHREPFLVDFRSGADSRPFVARVRALAGAGTNDPTASEVVHAQRPSDIIAYERIRTTPIVLAGVLALLAVATITHALVTVVRRRRHDLALLKTLGFTRRQVSAVVAWQATTVSAIALVAGLPLGIVLGRWGWRALADDIGTVAEPVVPLLAVLIAVPVVFAVVNAVAFVPGRVAARLRPATVLRSE